MHPEPSLFQNHITLQDFLSWLLYTDKKDKGGSTYGPGKNAGHCTDALFGHRSTHYRLSGGLSSRDAFFRDASVKGVTAPDGSIKHYAPGTIEKWYYTYKELGFNGLLPSVVPTLASRENSMMPFKNRSGI